MIMVTFAYAATVTKIPERTIRNWASEGLLAASPVNGRQQISMDQLEPLAEHWHNIGSRRCGAKIPAKYAEIQGLLDKLAIGFH